MIIPEFLVKGDTIGIITPSWEPDIDLVKKGIERLIDAGFLVKIVRNNFGGRGEIAPSEVRLREVNNAFCSTEFKALIFSRGGYGVMHLLPYLKYDCLLKHPKWIIGYSDATALFSALEKYNIAYIHGPMVESIGRGTHGWNELINLLKGNIPEYKLPPEEYNFKKTEGRIIGGCLSLITSLMGTPYEMDFGNRIVFLEDVSEKDYRVDRMLTQLNMAGKLEDAAMFIVGGEENHDVYREILLKTGKPLIIGFPAGHGNINLPLLMNVRALVDGGKMKFLL